MKIETSEDKSRPRHKFVLELKEEEMFALLDIAAKLEDEDIDDNYDISANDEQWFTKKFLEQGRSQVRALKLPGCYADPEDALFKFGG